MIDHTSFSTLALFDECALSWKAQRVDKVPQLPAPLMDEGNLTHKVLELYVTELAESDLDSYPGAIQGLVQQVFTDAQIPTTVGYKSVLIASMTFAKNFRLKPETLMGVEMKLETELGDGYPKVISYLDLVELFQDDKGEFIGITDWKTGWRKEQNARDEFQNRLYGVQARRQFTGKRIMVRNYYVRLNIYTEWEEITEWLEDETMRHAQAIYDRQQLAFKNRTWPSNPGKLCTYCPIAATRCDRLKNLTNEKAIVADKESATERLKDFIVFSAAANQLKKAIQNYVDSTGPLVGADSKGAQYVDGNPSITITDGKALYEAIEDEIWPLISITAKGVKGLQNDPRAEGLFVEKPGRRQFKCGVTIEQEEDDEATE